MDDYTEHMSSCKFMCWLDACSFLYIDFSSMKYMIHVLMSEAVISVFQKLNCKEIIEGLAKVLKKHPGRCFKVLLVLQLHFL